MTARTRNGGVSSRQRELRLAVVERGSRPTCSRMAKRAILRKRRLDVVRVGGAGVILRMTGVAGRRRAGESVIEMASRAVEPGVHTR